MLFRSEKENVETLKFKLKKFADYNRRLKTRNLVLENRVKRLEEHVTILSVIIKKSISPKSWLVNFAMTQRRL